MNRIVVLNPKGGSGKTTIATNLASYFASRQQKPVLMDFDPQGSSLRWVRKRQPTQPPIHVIAAFEKDSRTTRAPPMITDVRRSGIEFGSKRAPPAKSAPLDGAPAYRLTA